ncbi:uncharacterized protein LOC144448508 [Glandiceps talaboti]
MADICKAVCRNGTLQMPSSKGFVTLTTHNCDLTPPLCDVVGSVPSARQAAFPKDPRKWTRDHVIVWLLWATEQYKTERAEIDKFHMNGLGLIYMTKEGFVRRVPEGGQRLFEDFRQRFVCSLLEDQRSRKKIKRL